MTEQTTQSSTNLIKAFLAAQMEMGNATKDSKNPYFNSKYADLNSVREACIPVLNRHGIAVMQPTVQIGGKNYVKTILLHESGEMAQSLTEILYSKANDAQAQGSGITYARRYGLQSLVNIGAEDDDGNKAAEGNKKGETFFKEPSASPLGKVVDDEETAKLKEKKKRDSAETFFKEVKPQFEAEFSSSAELESLVRKFSKKIEALAKYPDLHNLLIVAIDSARERILFGTNEN